MTSLEALVSQPCLGYEAAGMDQMLPSTYFRTPSVGPKDTGRWPPMMMSSCGHPRGHSRCQVIQVKARTSTHTVRNRLNPRSLSAVANANRSMQTGRRSEKGLKRNNVALRQKIRKIKEEGQGRQGSSRSKAILGAKVVITIGSPIPCSPSRSGIEAVGEARKKKKK